jgi:hypothetical protein
MAAPEKEQPRPLSSGPLLLCPSKLGSSTSVNHLRWLLLAFALLLPSFWSVHTRLYAALFARSSSSPSRLLRLVDRHLSLLTFVYTIAALCDFIDCISPNTH